MTSTRRRIGSPADRKRAGARGQRTLDGCPRRWFGATVQTITAWGCGGVLALLRVGVADAGEIAVPAGFRIDVFAENVGGARALAVDSEGVLVVSISSRGRVLALPARRGAGGPTEVVTILKDLDRPHGLAFRRGYLYVAETGRIVRYRYHAGMHTAVEPTVVVGGLPHGAHHWTRSIAFGPDDKLYVAIGSSCAVCQERDPRPAAVGRYNADGSGEERFASGLRNPVGLGFHPTTGALWTTVNERDRPGGGAPPDYVTELRRGAAYGWPQCFAERRAFIPDPTFGGAAECRGMTLPSLELPPHAAPLGLAFYTGAQFPPEYVGDLFVALHGSRPGLPPAVYGSARQDVLGGEYEKLAGTVDLDLDPAHPANALIVDLDKAPRNARGRVEASADFMVLRPRRPPARGSVALLEVSNRGGKALLPYFNRAAWSRDPSTAADFGDRLLMRLHLTVIWIGWQFDVPREPGVLRLSAPVARGADGPIQGLVRSGWTVDQPTATLPLAHRDHVPYPASDPASPANVLTVRATRLGPPVNVP